VIANGRQVEAVCGAARANETLPTTVVDMAVSDNDARERLPGDCLTVLLAERCQTRLQVGVALVVAAPCINQRAVVAIDHGVGVGNHAWIGAHGELVDVLAAHAVKTLHRSVGQSIAP
jgi:hypothetical protein